MWVALLLLLLQDVDGLIERLGADDVDARERAAHELAALGEKAVPALLRAAESRDLERRNQALEILSRLSMELPADVVASHPVLTGMRVRREVESLLVQMEGEPLTALGHSESPSQYLERFPRYQRLVQIGKPAVPRLIEAAANESLPVPVRFFVVQALGRIADPRAVPMLVRLLHSDLGFMYSFG